MAAKLTPKGLVDQGNGKYFANLNQSYTITNGFGNTGLNFNSVYIPSGCTAVHFFFHSTLREPGSVHTCHVGFRMRVTGGHLSGNAYVGSSGWGFGITMPIRSGGHWAVVNQYANLMNYANSGNQAGLQAGQSYNFHLQAKDSASNGIKLGGENNGTWYSYTPHHGLIIVG